MTAPNNLNLSSIEANTHLLIAAAMQGNDSEVERLIPLSDPAFNDSQALCFSAANGHIRCVELLIPVSDPLSSDSVALRMAVCNSHLECARLLVPVSDPMAGDNTILLAAVLSKNEESVALLYPVSNVERVFHMLHKYHSARADEWEWFNGWKERVDAQRMHEVLDSQVQGVLNSAPKKI